MKIREMGADERPREKLLKFGPGVLSNVELLSVVLRTGTGRENALEVARNLLKAAGGSLSGLSSMSLNGMKGVAGVGDLKASTVKAAIELGRRFATEAFPLEKRPITTAMDIFGIMLPKLKGLDHEQCWVIYLNRSNYVIDTEMVSDGGLNETTMDIKLIIRGALEKKAAGMILVHNHPSGNPRPGGNDTRVTMALGKAAKMMHIHLLDHIIVSDSSYYSFENEVVVCLDDKLALLESVSPRGNE